MGYTNEQLAALILRNDGQARSWVFNRYCRFCAKFLYEDEIRSDQCKKCHTCTSDALARAIPFHSSATAITKLLMWVRDTGMKKGGTLGALHQKCCNLTQVWLTSRTKPETYYAQIIDLVGKTLEGIGSEKLAHSPR